MANYVVEPSLLQPYLPPGTQLDLHNDKCFVSLVAFMFINTRIKGVKIPFHINFEEINLRFYVKKGDKHGVVFIKEIVGLPAVTFIANKVYKENYETLPVSHAWIATPAVLNVEYRWKKGDWNVMRISTEKTPERIIDDSLEDFLTNKYWGFTKDHIYEVQHSHWSMYPVRSWRLDVDFASVYGENFGFLSNQKPYSVILAEGSEIAVLNKEKI